MRASDFSFVVFLALLGVHIWLRDPGWQTRAPDTWPILAGIPLFIWLGWPWTFAEAKSQTFPTRALIVAGVLYLVGLLSNLTMLLALAWTLGLRAWLIPRTVAGRDARHATKLLLLPFFSFPWLSTDLNSLGWAFRLSGAAVVENLFSALQYDVVREGTFLWVQGKLMSIEAACSGLNGLQSILIAGTTLAYLKLGASPYFWWNIPLLVAAAWLANTFRIVILAFGVTGGRLDAQNDFLHGVAGWASLCLAFGLCWLAFALQEARGRTPWTELARQQDG